MKPIILQGVVLLVLLCGAFDAHAAIVFSDNFEDVNAVTWPDAAQDADPVAQVGSYITIQEDQIEDVQVSDNAAPGPAGGSNY